MGQNNDFLKKNALKTAFWVDTILDRLTSGWARRPIFFKFFIFFNVHIKILPITLQMSHVEVIWLLNWPSNESLLCWGGVDARNGQKRRFLLNPPLLENFLLKNFSWVVPWERARTQLSEYVGHIGVHMIKNIVIAAQSQDRSAKVGSSRKIPDVTKN